MEYQRLNKISTGIEGYEHISCGGLIEGRTTLIVGSSGSGKTVMSLEMLYRGVRQHDRRAVFVTFEERPEDIIRNVQAFGWDMAQFIEEGKMMIIDASPARVAMQEAGNYDLSGLVAQIEHAIDNLDAKFVVMDSLGTLFLQFARDEVLRREILRFNDALREKGVTSVMTAERLEEYGSVSRHGIEEFVSDSVVILRHDLAQEHVRRTIQIYKMRGSNHHEGEFPFLIDASGVHILPLSAATLTQESTNERLSFGEPKLDELTGGGLFRDSIILVSGPTGGGKTLMCTTFAAEGCKKRERVLYLGFEESQQQLNRNADSWGLEFPIWQENELLKVVCLYPEAQGLEAHLLGIRQMIEDFRPQRLIIDSVSALERIGEVRYFREFVIGLTSYVKQNQICTLLTSTTPELSGGESVTEAHISTITDAIILLRYIETHGLLDRGLLVIKMRGSQHSKQVHQFTIDSKGMQIGDPFRDGSNIIMGIPSSD